MGKASNRKRIRRGQASPPIDGCSIFGPDIPPYTAADADADVVAIENDRSRFAASPSLASYRREPEPGEMRAAIPHGCDLIAVEVFQIAPGYRLRVPMFRRIARSEIN